MDVAEKVVVVTGGASGIGAAMARRFAAEGARGVVIGDLDEAGAAAVGDEIGGAAARCDVTVEVDIVQLVRLAEKAFGPVDLFCSNAGGGAGETFDAPDDQWLLTWQLNTMAHVYAARAVVPSMLERGGGWLLQTVSAGGLVTGPASAPYTVTKHAAIGFAEWMAIMYGNRGIGVSCLCPQAVNTRMVQSVSDPATLQALNDIGTLIEPHEVASAVIDGLRDERFLILPNPEVAEYFLRKATDYDRWLRGMKRMVERSGLQR
jgi:NAD(P)-dependent dehydrogenase (short-subunit alcohol dehydrogenase family)